MWKKRPENMKLMLVEMEKVSTHGGFLGKITKQHHFLVCKYNIVLLSLFFLIAHLICYGELSDYQNMEKV